MRTIHLNPNDQLAREIASASFPGYKGKKFKVVIHPDDYPFSLRTGWDGGSRDSFVIVRLADYQAVKLDAMPFVGDQFSRNPEAFQLPEGFAIVRHAIFQGEDLGLAIWIIEANAAKLLPKQETLTYDEKLVLACTRGLKSAFRCAESGLSPEVWTSTQAALIERGLLATNKSITVEGRNAIGDITHDRLKYDRERAKEASE